MPDMKNNKLLINIISLLLSLCMLTAIGSAVVFAEGEDDAAVYDGEVVDDPGLPAEEPMPGEDQPAAQPEQPDTPQEQYEAPVETSAPEREPMYEYIYGYSEDVTSTYEAPKYLGELPEVTSSEVVMPTAVVIPDVVVSDATMFSGIVMWLCVALGIAVIVGVLVSKRTRRRGV